MTVIAFVGSVFSPRYRRARLTSLYPDPERYCAINVAVYGPRGSRWVFTEVPPARRTAASLALSGSLLRWEGDTLWVELRERAAVGGRRVAGRIRLDASRRFDHPIRLDPDGHHQWWPVAPHARIHVELDAPALSFRGSGYHDANFGREGLEDAFSSWWWSRTSTTSDTEVRYDVVPRGGEPRARGFVFGADGRMHDLPHGEALDLGRSGWGLARPSRRDPAQVYGPAKTLEDTPFYARSLLRCARTQRVGMHEALDLDRFRRPLVQRMLPFRIRQDRGSG